MFNINIEELKNKVMSNSEDIIRSEIKESNKDCKDKDEIMVSTMTTLTAFAINSAVKLIEENNKAIWNDLVSRGVIKE